MPTSNINQKLLGFAKYDGRTFALTTRHRKKRKIEKKK